MELNDMLTKARSALADIDPNQLDPSGRIAYATAVGQVVNASAAHHTAGLLDAWFEIEAKRTQHIGRIADKIAPLT